MSIDILLLSDFKEGFSLWKFAKALFFVNNTCSVKRIKIKYSYDVIYFIWYIKKIRFFTHSNSSF